jgi:rod shape-determining protein MreC
MSFFRKNKERILVILVAMSLIVLVGITSTERIALSRFENTIGNMLTPIGKISNSMGENTSGIFKGLRDLTNLKDENESLKKQILKLEDENRDYLNIIGKTDYLKNELKLLDKTDFKLTASQIVGKEPGNWFNRFTIDKGKKDGIKKGDIVIQGIEIEQNIITEGIVGRVVDVGDRWAKVVTIVDEDSNISFKVLRTQDGGIVSGSMDGKISGYLFDDKADIIKGDKLYTSGLGGGFIEDLYLGEVNEVISDDEDLMKKIEVKPAINFKKLYKVYVISD